MHIRRHEDDARGRYRERTLLSTVLIVLSVVLIAILWARLIPQKGTFFGIAAAGLAVALREPLLSIAGRIAIFAGRIFTVEDRIEVQGIKGDVIDVGFFYTRMMEIGNWISSDQVTGRIVQIANARFFGNPVFNYTRDFDYIWDEIKIPITYTSNVKAAIEIVLGAGEEYSQKILKPAEQRLRQIQRYFLIPHVELKPQVFLKVTSNWIELSMRYLVEPKKRGQPPRLSIRGFSRRCRASGHYHRERDDEHCGVPPSFGHRAVRGGCRIAV